MVNTYLGEGQYFVLLANEITKYPKIQIKRAKYLGTPSIIRTTSAIPYYVLWA